MHALLFCEDLSDDYPSFVASEAMGIANAIARDFPVELFEGTRAKRRLDRACAKGGLPQPGVFLSAVARERARTL